MPATHPAPHDGEDLTPLVRRILLLALSACPKPLPPVGNYNAVWVDPGAHVAVVNGELRSSWITEPANGKIPYKAGRGGARYEGPVGGNGATSAAAAAAASLPA